MNNFVAQATILFISCTKFTLQVKAQGLSHVIISSFVLFWYRFYTIDSFKKIQNLKKKFNLFKEIKFIFNNIFQYNQAKVMI